MTNMQYTQTWNANTQAGASIGLLTDRLVVECWFKITLKKKIDKNSDPSIFNTNKETWKVSYYFILPSFLGRGPCSVV